jgi:hypothetical protein
MKYLGSVLKFLHKQIAEVPTTYMIMAALVVFIMFCAVADKKYSTWITGTVVSKTTSFESDLGTRKVFLVSISSKNSTQTLRFYNSDWGLWEGLQVGRSYEFNKIPGSFGEDTWRVRNAHDSGS